MAIEYTRVTSTRLSPEQRVIVDSAAEIKGIGVSEWLRRVAVTAAWEQVDATRPGIAATDPARAIR
jgi:uncharacterized protein (DUF1778 family)